MQSITAAGTVRLVAPKPPTGPVTAVPAIDRRTRKPRLIGPKNAPQQRDKCGTRAGWLAHQYYHELPCEGCAAAHADYHREYDRAHRAKGR